MEHTLVAQNKVPNQVWAFSVALSLLRLGAFFMFAVPTHMAQWQLNMIPLWILDFPISLVYFFIIPAPYAESILGPIWWALLPYLVWRIAQRIRRKRAPQ